MSDFHRPKKIHRTLVWGGWYGSRNIGDTAILLGIRELYKKINADRHYYLGYLSTDTDYTNTNGVSGKQALVKSDVFKPWKLLRLIGVFREADRVIISGGTPIFDFSHKIRSLYFFLPLILRKPFILFGAGVKPITSRYGRWYIPFTLKKADYISARDDGSTKILTDLGLVKTVKTADSAFFAPAADRSELEPVLKRYGIQWDDKILTVAPRLMSSDKKRLYLDEDMGDDIISETPKKIAKAIDAVADKFDTVAFMAMHYYGPDSDVELIREIIGLTQAKNVVFIEEELRPEVGIGLFKHSYVVLAMRLHAVLLSGSMATPVVGIAYEQKVTDLLTRLEQSSCALDMFNFTEEQLVKTLKNTIKNRAQIHSQLSKRVKQLRELVLKDAETVLKIEEEFTEK